MVISVKIFKTKKTIEIHLVLSEKYVYKSVKTALLLSNIIDADHQNSCLFTNKGYFSLPLWVFIGVLATFLWGRGEVTSYLKFGFRWHFMPYFRISWIYNKVDTCFKTFVFNHDQFQDLPN